MSQTPRPILEIYKETLNLEAQMIQRISNKLTENSDESKAIIKAITLLGVGLNKKNKIIVIGIGKSGKIAQKIAATLSSTGSPSIFIHPTEALHGDLGLIQDEDPILAYSYTGNTEEVMKLIPHLKKRGNPIIAVTANPQSQLAELADVTLDASVTQEACPHNLAPTCSTTVALAIGDAIAVSLMESRGFNAESFAQNHPGGSLGRKLNMTLSHIMHKPSLVGQATLDTSIEEIIVEATQKHLGAVVVLEGSKLIGIITDGDLRRALSHKENFFKLKAKDVMNPNPKTAQPELRAQDALYLMENKKAPLSILPVTNLKGEFLGLVRLLDLIQSF